MLPATHTDLFVQMALYTLAGVMLWKLCSSSRGLMNQTPQLWAAGLGFALAFTLHGSLSLLRGEQLTPLVLLADYTGIILGQLVVAVYMLLGNRPHHHPHGPLAHRLRPAAARELQQPHLVLLTEDEAPLQMQRGFEQDPYTLRLVA
jgi:hypothetical protein